MLRGEGQDAPDGSFVVGRLGGKLGVGGAVARMARGSEGWPGGGVIGVMADGEVSEPMEGAFAAMPLLAFAAEAVDGSTGTMVPSEASCIWGFICGLLTGAGLA